MELCVFLAAVTVFLVMMTLLAPMGREEDRRRARIREARTAQTEEKQTKKKSSAGLIKTLRARARERQRARLLGEELNNTRTKKKLSAAEKLLQTAGVSLTSFQFSMIKLGLGLVLAAALYLAADPLIALAGLSDRMTILFPAVGLIVGYLLPAKWLEARASKRRSLYRDALPDVMDLLVVSVEAGLGFDAALLRLYEKDKSPLMQELMRSMQDIQHGMSKKEAYAGMAARCDVKEITSFLNAIVQAEQMGISVKTVLKAQAESLREERRQRAEEKALKAPVTMLVPMVIFIFPVIFIILLGPAAMNIMEIMG